MLGSIAFVFPGQGSQSLGMLADLASIHPLVQEVFTDASAALGVDLWQLVQEGPVERLNQTRLTQPAMLAAGYAVYRVWEEEGGSAPDFVAGHSLGEYTALVVAEALDFADAVRLVAERGRLMQEAVPEGEGLMAAVLGPDREQVEEILARAIGDGEGVVSVANDNCPGQCVIAGSRSKVLRAIDLLKEAGVRKVLTLPVSVPSHTSLMHRAALSMKDLLSQVTLSSLSIPVVPNVTARPLKAGEASGEIRNLLVRQIESPVEWRRSVAGLLEDGVARFVEVGPGSVLTGLGKRIEKAVEPREKIIWESTDRKEDRT